MRCSIHLLLCGALCAFVASACSKKQPFVSRDTSVLNTPLRITAPVSHAHTLTGAIDAVRFLDERFQPLINIYVDESEIARANQIASISRFPISRDTQQILHYTKNLSERLEGYYDVTDATLRHTWARHFQTGSTAFLSDALVRATQAGVGHEKLRMSDHSLLFMHPKTQLDLNDFAPAYIIDLAILRLREQGMGHVRIESAYYGRALGRAAPDQAWNRAIPHPTNRQLVLGDLTVPDGMAYAMTGWPDHFTGSGTNRIARIINPNTGWPAEGRHAVIVMGPVTCEAYALSRTLFILGPEEGQAIWQRQFPRYKVMYIDLRPPHSIDMHPDLAPLFSLRTPHQTPVEVFNEVPTVPDGPVPEPIPPDTGPGLSETE